MVHHWLLSLEEPEGVDMCLARSLGHKCCLLPPYLRIRTGYALGPPAHVSNWLHSKALRAAGSPSIFPKASAAYPALPTAAPGEKGP